MHQRCIVPQAMKRTIRLRHLASPGTDTMTAGTSLRLFAVTATQTRNSARRSRTHREQMRAAGYRAAEGDSASGNIRDG